MVFVPEEVRCAVCKSIFCCLECRNRHELNAHNANDVWAERNRMRCGFCQGYSTMEFQSRNDFALIMHLCQTHLPLHCKKCLTEFKSIGDFSARNKCAHMNDVCSLQSVLGDKTQTTDALKKVSVRQTSTPMHHNLVGNNSPDSNGQSCSSCLASFASAHMSSINSSSDSDTSNNSISKLSDIREHVQQSIMVTQRKTTMFKRFRHSVAGTPLTRQVMTKSIHRAILEYQHSQIGGVLSPKSPLDLRVRSTVTRDATEKCSEGEGSAVKSPMPHQPMSSILHEEKLNGADDMEVWFTPKEYVQSKVIENIEIYTPKVSKKRANVRRFEDKECSPEHGHQSTDFAKREPSQTSGSKLWSFVSTFFRFASLTPSNDLSIPALNGNNGEPHMLIKRCASFTGVLREKNLSNQSEDDNELEPLHPIKRRRITSMDTSPENTEVNYNKRIMCRPAIRRMQNN